MRLFRFFVATVVLAGFWLTALPARAGTVTWSLPTWEKREGTNRKVDVLNRQDCLNDAEISFSVRVAAVSTSAVLELWVGTGCDTQTNRNPANKQCVQVSGSNTVNTALNQTVTARFQDMVRPYGSTDKGTADSCDLETSTGLVTRSLFFVVYNSGSTMPEAMGMPWVFKYDVRAPGPPTNVKASGAEDSLVVNLAAPSGETNLLRYHFYCSPVSSSPVSTDETGGTGGTSTGAADTGGTGAADTGGTGAADTGGTGAADTGGTDTGGTVTGTSVGGASDDSTSDDPSCRSDILIPNQPPPADAIDCGTVGAQGITSGETSQVLDDGDTYAVAVATEDTANNIGVLSKISCGSPRAITGFYEAYRAAGGKGGGGFCGFAPARSGKLATLLALCVAACAVARRRR